MKEHNKCKHSGAFRFLRLTAADRYPGVWACSSGCGYSLPFDPEHFLTGIVYLEQPNPAYRKVILLVPDTIDQSKGDTS